MTSKPLEEAAKPKAFIHWVSSTAEDEVPERAEVRVYSRL